jgi:nucleotide-binding universal stress UspA family protein
VTSAVTLARLVVGVDFDDTSASAARAAGRLATAAGATITAFHAAVPDAPAYFTPDQIADLEAEREARRASLAADLRRFLQPQIPHAIDVVIGDGPPGDGLVRLAAEADLVVIGTHQRHGPRRWWLGSVAENVVSRSPGPVLVVPRGTELPSIPETPTVLVAGGSREADAWGVLLGHLLGGRPVHTADLRGCDPELVRRAGLVVWALPAGGRQPLMADAGPVLRECARPVLFIPPGGGTVEGNRS